MAVDIPIKNNKLKVEHQTRDSLFYTNSKIG